MNRHQNQHHENQPNLNPGETHFRYQFKPAWVWRTIEIRSAAVIMDSGCLSLLWQNVVESFLSVRVIQLKEEVTQLRLRI
jgi:hypothetical protein